MSLEFITELYVPVVMVICLLAGYILKHWISDVDNRIIPTMVAVLGAVCACINAKGVSLELVASGAVTGLASTGLHQMFKQLIEGKKNGN